MAVVSLDCILVRPMRFATSATGWHRRWMTSENAQSSSFQPALRSDSLPAIVRALESVPELWTLLVHKLVCIHFVVDASVINSELRWRLAKRRKSEARSALEEAVDAGVVTLVAPLYLATEIEEHLAEIAEETHSSLDASWAEWRKVRSKLRFYAPPSGTRVGNIVDPDDIAYMDSSVALGLPVYTNDRHFEAMGVPAVLERIDLHLRDHARGMAVTLTFSVMSAAALLGTFVLLRHAILGIRRLLGAFSSLPEAVQGLLIGGVLVALIHPASRTKLQALWNTIRASEGEIMAHFGDLAVAGLSAWAAAEARSELARREVTRAMPAGSAKHSALVLARRACCLSSGPLSLIEITRCLQQYGHISRAKNFPAYLRRILRESGEFVEASRGIWAFCPPAQGIRDSLT